MKYENVLFLIEMGRLRLLMGHKRFRMKCFFILINLIQEKSSAMFSKSIGNEKYIDGIIRLLVALIECTGNHNVLNEKGWFWNFLRTSAMFLVKRK